VIDFAYLLINLLIAFSAFVTFEQNAPGVQGKKLGRKTFFHS